jgi:hypothetical protein
MLDYFGSVFAGKNSKDRQSETDARNEKVSLGLPTGRIKLHRHLTARRAVDLSGDIGTLTAR